MTEHIYNKSIILSNVIVCAAWDKNMTIESHTNSSNDKVTNNRNAHSNPADCTERIGTSPDITDAGAIGNDGGINDDTGTW